MLSSFKISGEPISENANTATKTPTTAPPDTTTKTPTTAPPDTTTETPATKKADVVRDVIGGLYVINGQPLFANEIRDTIVVKNDPTQQHHVANDEVRDTPLCFNETVGHYETSNGAIPPPNTSPTSNQPSESAQTVIYNTSGDQYVWLSEVGARGSWVTALASSMNQEFPTEDNSSLDASVPLLQPLWGTLKAFTATGLAHGSMLSGPPPLPEPTRECVNGSPLKPLVVLPARWVHRPPTTEVVDESGMPILTVPPAVSLNMLSVAAQALLLSGPMAGTTPTFRVPIFAMGGVRSVADTVNAATMKGEPWGLLGVRGSADAKRIFRAAMLEDAPNAHVELLRAGRARVVRVLPSCGGAGGCTWCEEVTVAVPLHLRASATGRELQMAVWVSVTEIVCSNGGVAPHVADSLAAAVHLGALMGAEDGVTHVVVLGEDHVAHTLTHRGGDRQLFHDRLLGDNLDSVGHTFLEQVLGAWAGNGGCRGPRAVQAIVVEPSSTPSKEQCDVTSAALNTTLSDLVVDHHGVMFESTTVIVPSWPTTTTKTVTDEGDNCHSGHRCIKMKDMVNAIFHPFTTMEGVVSVRRRHQLPLKTRKVLGVVDAAAVQDVIQEGAASPHIGQHAVEAVDAVSPLSVCIEARSFAQVNGLYGRAGGRWVATVEDVAGALRSRVVPLMIRHRRRVECATGGGGVVGAALRVLRVVTRHVVSHGASHAGGEESVVGSRLSSGLRDLALIIPPAPTPEEGIERPTLAQFVIRRSPLVAACARVVRIPVGVHVIREVAALDETTLRLLLTPRLVHMGDTQNTGFHEPETQNTGFHEPEKETVDNELVASAKRVSRALFRIVAGVPTSMCVPDGLFHVVRAHANAMASYQENDDHVSLEERLQREFSPWCHAQCSGGEDMAVCVARAQLRHMQQMLECDAMGEWLRRVSDDMRVLTQSDGTGTFVTKSFVEESISQATALGDALCQRWGCSWEPGARRAGKILYRQQHSTTAKVPGAESDVTRTLGLGDLSHIQLGNGSMMVSFIRSVLTSPLLDDVSSSTVSVGHTLQSRTDLCLAPGTCSPFHVGATSHFIAGPLTLWQQWALRYVRMLLQTPKAPRHRLNTASSANSDHSLVRAQSGHGRLFDGDWSGFAWGSLGARTKLSLDFALSRFIPSSDTPGSSPGAAALTNLVAAQTVEAADTHMKAALRHLSTTELTMMLRRPLMREALSAAETACRKDSRQVFDYPMPIARAVVRHLRMRSWDMGPDSVVDLVDRAKGSWLNCALKGLDWLERGHRPGPGGVESELHLWLSKKGAAQNITTAADRLSFMFARDLQCMFPPSTSHLDPDVNNVRILSSRAVAMAYTFLLSIVRHTAFDLLDSSSSIELLLKTTTKKPSFCKSSLGTAHPVGHDLSFDRSALHYRIPCYFCCGFMTEMKGYFPSMIEDKGLPLSISYQREECLCNMDSADASYPQDVYRRSLLVSCDNNCNPNHLPPGSEKSFTDKDGAEEVYFGAKQRHYRGHQPPPQDGSKPGRSFAIWIDHAIPPHMPFSRDTVIPFVQVDRIRDDRIAWGEKGKDMAPPLDRALARNLFTTYNDLGEVIHAPLRFHSSNNSNPNEGSGYDSQRSGIIRSSKRGYRICRAMYEADRINQDWGRIVAHHCDEIWTPSNWGKTMYVNTFVTPHMELAFVPRTMDGDETSTRVCMGCLNLSASESSLLLPPTTSYQPVSINVDALRLRTDLKLSDEEMTIEHIQQRILSEEKNTLLQQLVEGLPYQVLAMLRQNQPAVQFINKEAYMTELVLAVRNHAVTFDRLAHDARGHQPPNPPCNAATCRPPLVIGIGNTSHQLAYRLHLTSIFDLSKIVAIPESVDVNNMDPAIATPIDTSAPVKNSTKAPDNNDDKRPGTGGTIPDTSNLPDSTRPGLFQPGDKSFRWERWCSRKCFRGPRGNRRFISREESFRFLSVFKWEPRKGWSELMEAFYSAFYEPLYNNSANGKEPMLIIVGKSHRPIDTYSPVHFSSKLVEDWLQTTSLPVIPPHNQDKPSLGRPDFPCMCFITQALTNDDLVSVYRSVDAFVHLTRGEGWGLPISEAMAMGLPTISTHWGGSTEFTSHGSMPAAVNVTHHDTPASYTVNATTFESPDTGDGYEANMRMAAPSIPHAMELLRNVYEQSPKVNQEVGRRAREVIVREFSQAATTDMMAVRLAVIAQKLRWESDEEWETRRQNNLKRGL